MTDSKKRVFSGVQPSGNLHIGNYLGAIRQFVELQKSHRAVFCIVDEHAITIPQDPKELRQNTLDLAMVYLAAGIDPKKSIIFAQSHVPAHAELGWLLNTITPLGELERMTQFKEKKVHEKNKAGVPAGLLNYPTLMAADILLYQTDLVPVGEDQVQHIELTRMLANKFNKRFGKTFRVPEPLLQKETARIMRLDDPSKKMSKSSPSKDNAIMLMETADEIRRKIKIAVTDSGSGVRYDKAEKPAISNLMAIYSGFSGTTMKEVENKFRGAGYGDFKKDLADLLIKKLSPLQERYRKLSKNKKEVLKTLRDGAKRASLIADKTLADAKQKMGFLL